MGTGVNLNLMFPRDLDVEFDWADLDSIISNGRAHLLSDSRATTGAYALSIYSHRSAYSLHVSPMQKHVQYNAIASLLSRQSLSLL